MKINTTENSGWKQDRHQDRYSKAIMIIFIAALLIRLIGVNDIMYNDEATRAVAIRDSGFLGNLVGKDTGHPPLYSWIAMSFTSLLGMSTAVFRLIHIIFGVLTIYLVFIIARRYFGSKAALWSVAIIGFSYYHILASIQITIDGSLLAFFYLLTIYFFMRYSEADSRDELAFNSGKKNFITNRFKINQFRINKWLPLAGLAFGLAMLTKVSAVLVLPPIVIYSLIKSKSIKKAAGELAVVCAIGALMFSSYLVLSVFDPSGIEFVKARAQEVAVNSPINLSLLAIQFVQAAIWMGPFILGMILLSFFWLIDRGEDKQGKKNTYLMLLFIATIVFFYVFIIRDNFRPVERYFMVLTAPISILAGAYLSRIKFEKKHLLIFTSVFVIFSGFLVWLNLKQNEYLPFYPKEEFIRHAAGFDWTIYTPFLGNEGPVGFYLSLDSIAYSFILAFIALGIYLAAEHAGRERKSNRRETLAISALAVFLAISAAFNLIITEEYLIGKMNPDIEKVSSEMIDYVQKNDVKTPLLFFRNFALEFYTEPKYGECPYQLAYWDECSIDFTDNKNPRKLELIEKGGTIIVVDFPKISRESLLWKKFSECRKLKSFYDKGQEVGFIIEC